jgi:hypothetical protein
VYVPFIEEENLQDEEPLLPDDRKRLLGLQETNRFGLEGDAARLMLPEKPPRLVRVTLEVVEEPAAKMIDAGFTAMPKSTTLMVTLTLWETEPLVPMTVTV